MWKHRSGLSPAWMDRLVFSLGQTQGEPDVGSPFCFEAAGTGFLRDRAVPLSLWQYPSRFFVSRTGTVIPAGSDPSGRRSFASSSFCWLSELSAIRRVSGF